MSLIDPITYRHISGDDPLPYIDCECCIRAIYTRIQHYIHQDTTKRRNRQTLRKLVKR